MEKCTDTVVDWMIRCNVINEADKELYKYALHSLLAATMLFSVPAMAKKNFFSFNVKTSVNDGEAFSAGNPKNDAERQAYVVTQDSNIISTDE